MNRIIIFLLLISACIQFTGQTKNISLEQIWKTFDFYPQTSYKTYDKPDSELYLQVKADSLISRSYILPEYSETVAVVDSSSEFLINPQKYWINKPANLLLSATDCNAIYRYSYSARYSLYDIESKTSKPVYNDSLIQSAQFSPNGESISFVCNNNLFIQHNDSIIQITKDGQNNKIINGLPDWVYEEEFQLSDAYEWSPDSRFILYLKFDESEVKQMQLPFYQGKYPEQYSFKYPKAGEQNSDVSLWVYDTQSGKNSLLLNAFVEGFEYIPRIQWNSNKPDQCIAWLLNRRQNKLKITSITIPNKKVQTLYEEESDTYLETGSMVYFSENSEHYCHISDSGMHRTLIDNTGKIISPPQSDVTEVFGYNKSDDAVYFQVAVTAMERQVFKYRFSDKKLQQLTHSPGFHSVRIVAGGKYLIEKYSSHSKLPQFSLTDTNGKFIRMLEDNSDKQKKMKAYEFPERQFFSFVTERGDTLNGWKILPPNYKKNSKYPLLLTVYGGPSHQTVTNSWDYGYYWQVCLAQRGYIVASVDCRGTESRGNHFKKQTYGKLGIMEAEDFISAANYLKNQKYVDAERIGIQGWSYGGYMALMSLCLSDDVFKAGIAIAPVSDWQFYDNIYAERYMNTPQNNPQGYRESSVASYINGMNEKLLLMHGSFDDNVHIQNSHIVAKELIKQGKDFEYMVYPDSNHSIFKGNARIHLFKKMFSFIEQNL